MKNKPQIEIHLNWMKSNEQEPSKETLRTLYGAEDGKESDAAEIKDYALKGCSNLQEAIRVIIHYAEDLNREQQRYLYRSSYEDRSQSVSSVDEIAFQHMEELVPFCDPDTELTLELAKELQTEGYPLEFPQRQKKMYETIEALPEKLREQFQKVQNLKGQIAQVEWERSDFSQYYLKPIEDQFAELQKEEQQIKKRSPLSKWWNRGKLESLEQERKQLELAKAPLLETINAMNKSIEVTQKALSKTAYELEHFSYPWEDGNLDTIHPIRTEAELEQTIQEIRRYGEQPEIQEAYRAAVRLLDAVQRPEFPSFAEERERRKQTSFPEKENRQGISSELERDGEAFTQLR